MKMIKIAIILIALFTLSTSALAQSEDSSFEAFEALEGLSHQVDFYQTYYERLNTYERGKKEQHIASLVLLDSFQATNILYRSIHQTSEYFNYDLMGRRDRMFRYILTNQSWDNSQLQEMANELFVAGYSWEAVTILNYVIDERLPGNYR